MERSSPPAPLTEAMLRRLIDTEDLAGLAPYLVPCPEGCRCSRGEHLSRVATRQLIDDWDRQDADYARLQRRTRGIPEPESVPEFIARMQKRVCP